jgi:hypothetical protein
MSDRATFMTYGRMCGWTDGRSDEMGEAVRCKVDVQEEKG